MSTTSMKTFEATNPHPVAGGKVSSREHPFQRGAEWVVH